MEKDTDRKKDRQMGAAEKRDRNPWDDTLDARVRDAAAYVEQVKAEARPPIQWPSVPTNAVADALRAAGYTDEQIAEKMRNQLKLT